VVSVGIQDPGNLGAVARVAEATGVGALIVTKGSADPFGPKTVRGSMGSVLRLCILDGVSEETMIASLKARRFRLAATLPRGGIDFRQAVRERPLALVLGGESRGLPNAIVERCDVGLSIPMAGAVESLNVAMVAGIVLYEATREVEGGSS
jgi:TrmH family RNA methyltransferase